jgi:hypothetical protein
MGSHSGPRRGLLARWRAHRAYRRRYKALVREHLDLGWRMSPYQKVIFEIAARQEKQQ